MFSSCFEDELKYKAHSRQLEADIMQNYIMCLIQKLVSEKSSMKGVHHKWVKDGVGLFFFFFLERGFIPNKV